MLQITPEQWPGIAADGRRAFVIRVAAFLRANVPGMAGEPDRTLHPQVEAQIVRAFGYGLESEQAVATYVVTAAWLGPEFDTRFPAAAAVLNARDMDEGRKADWLDAWTIELFEQLGGA